MKTCIKCGETKPLEAFKNRKDSPDGKRNDCRTCWVKREELRRQKPEVKARLLARSREKRRRDYTPEGGRRQQLKAKYGITLEDYNQMLEAQDGKCAICGEAGDKVLVVDHDHETGKVRKLLCQPCNKGLGHFRDRVEFLISGAAYLMEHKWLDSTAATGSLATLPQ